MGVLRGRGRAVTETSEGADVVPMWGYSGGVGIGKGSGRVSMAGLIATRPGLRTRLFYRLHVYHGRKREPKGLGEA